MKTWIRTSLAAAVAATFGAAAIPASAGPSADCGATRDGAGMHRMHKMHRSEHGFGPGAMTERADRHLASLEAALALRPDQATAWDAFSSTMRGIAAKAEARRESMRERERAATALERLERMEEFASARLESMQEMRAAVEGLHATLDDGQKKAFDEAFRMAGPRHRGDGHRGPRHPDPAAGRGPGA